MKAARTLFLRSVTSLLASGATLHLKKREIRTGDQPPQIDAPGPRWMGGRSHLILQFHHAVNEETLQKLHARGAYVVGGMPDFGVTVSTPDDFSLSGLDVEWAGRVEMEDKISPALAGHQGLGESWFVAEFFPDVDK